MPVRRARQTSMMPDHSTIAAMPPLEDEYDLIVIGSGGGAIPAALVAKQFGKRAVILEKMDQVGGSTSFSGGVWWVPNNSLLKEAGIADSFDRARDYFDAVVTYQGPGVTPQRRDAFLRRMHVQPKVLAFDADIFLSMPAI